MSRPLKILLSLYFLLFLFGAFFSWGLVIPNLIFSQNSLWLNFQWWHWHLWENYRPLLTILFSVWIIALFTTYFSIIINLFKTNPKKIVPKQNPLSLKSLLLTLALLILPLLFSYNAFSADVFNYIFNAKMVTTYHADPHTSVAADFPSDPMLTFMHNNHTAAPYGRAFTLLSLPWSLLGFGKFSLTWLSFRLAALLVFSLTIFLIIKIFQNQSLLFSPIFSKTSVATQLKTPPPPTLTNIGTTNSSYLTNPTVCHAPAQKRDVADKIAAISNKCRHDPAPGKYFLECGLDRDTADTIFSISGKCRNDQSGTTSRHRLCPSIAMDKYKNDQFQESPLLALLFLNPLFLLEPLMNFHNDLWMMSAVLASLFFLLLAKKTNSANSISAPTTARTKTTLASNKTKKLLFLLLSALALFLSIFIKYSSLVFIPFWLFLIFNSPISTLFNSLKSRPLKKIAKILLAFFETYFFDLLSLAFFLPLLLPRAQYFHPWYLLWSLVWIPFTRWPFTRYLLLAFSLSSLLRYFPFLWQGNYSGSVLFNQQLITWLGALIIFIIFLLIHLRKNPRPYLSQ